MRPRVDSTATGPLPDIITRRDLFGAPRVVHAPPRPVRFRQGLLTAAGPASHSSGLDGTRCPTVRAPFPLWTLPSPTRSHTLHLGRMLNKGGPLPVRPGSRCPTWVGTCIPQLQTTQGLSDSCRPRTAANHPHVRQAAMPDRPLPVPHSTIRHQAVHACACVVCTRVCISQNL